MEKKMTYTKAIDNALAVVTDEATRNRLEELKNSIAKRNANGGTRKPTKEQRLNAEIKATIAEVLADGTARTVTEIMHLVPALENASNQKASALVNQMVKDGTLVRSEVKRKAYFGLA